MGMQPEGLDEECWQQQQGLQQNGQGQQKGQQHHGKKRPKPGLMMKRTPQQKLVAQLNRQRQLYSRLQQEGAKLRGHESTLLRSVAQQSAMLHTLGTVLGEDVMVSLRDSEHHAAALRALLADVDAHRLLQQLEGGSVPAALQQQYAQLFTARMLGAAVTPASVAAIRTASVEQDIVPQLQQLTSELSHLLSVHTGGEASDRLVEKVREHCRLMQLLQAAAQEKMWRLASMNLETLQEAVPLVAHWENVAASLELRPEQLEQLSAAYEIYNSKRHQLCQELQECTEQLQPLLGPHHHSSSHNSSGLAAAEHSTPGSTAAAAPSSPSRVSTAAAAASGGAESPTTSGASGSRGGDVSSNSSGSAAAAAAAAEQEQMDWLLDLDSAEAASSLLLRMEHLTDAISVIKLYMRNAYVNCLDKVQLARACVHSWPYIMNVWVLTAVALGLHDADEDQQQLPRS
uniref:Uncharacterized protein n=1 Tax=Tetradesmus obliquus TaxID=3088 RepID=A0A383W2R0_TETOB|eukprot:jgi/Sobl393_1/12700/SZX71937.1